MKLCPPKRGFTVITRIRSTRSRTNSIASGGVDGLRDTPALRPLARIGAIEMGASFDVRSDNVRARLNERAYVRVYRRDHQMNIHDRLHVRPDRLA